MEEGPSPGPRSLRVGYAGGAYDSAEEDRAVASLFG